MRGLRKKRARDTAADEAGPSTKRSKPSTIGMVLNSTADRDVAINKLFEAVNDVSKTTNMSEITNDNHNPITDQSPAKPIIARDRKKNNKNALK